MKYPLRNSGSKCRWRWDLLCLSLVAASLLGSPITIPVSTAFTFRNTATRTSFRQSSRNFKILLASSENEQEEEPPPLFGIEQDVPLPPSEVESLTVPQLKQQLRLRGLKVSGRKKELQDRLLGYFENQSVNQSIPAVEPEVIAADAAPSDEEPSEARRFAQERGKELIDVTAYLDEDEKDRAVRASSDEKLGEKDESVDDEAESTSSGPEVWGSEARIVDDYEGRSVVVDNLSRTIVEYKGSNQTFVQAFVVASRDALKAFLEGGEKGKNQTSSTEERLREIQSKREAAARVPLRFEDDEGLDEGDETGLYSNIVERDFTDWGKFTQTGVQLSAAEVQGVLLLSDVYGAFTEDTRMLAEKIAFECQPVVVMVPDLFRGRPWEEHHATPGLNAEGQSYEQWRTTHPDLRVSIDIRAAASCLREKYGVSSIAVWGTCYGGGRALEVASGYFPDGVVHDFDGSIGPPRVEPMSVVAWYPTRYNANLLFGSEHKGSNMDEKQSLAVMAVFAGKDTIPGATPEDAAHLKRLLEEDDRIKDHMVKVFPDQDHGFAHIGMSGTREGGEDEFERFVDEEFGGAGRVGIDGGDAEVACLLSTAWMETYSRVFLPTTGPAVSLDENEAEWNGLNMKDLSEANTRDVRDEIENALDSFVEEPLGGKRIDQTDESQKEELAELLKSMQSGEDLGPYTINPDDDLATIYAKLKASDENFQIF